MKVIMKTVYQNKANIWAESSLDVYIIQGKSPMQESIEL